MNGERGGREEREREREGGENDHLFLSSADSSLHDMTFDHGGGGHTLFKSLHCLLQLSVGLLQPANLLYVCVCVCVCVCV